VHDVVAHQESLNSRRDRKVWGLTDVVVVHGHTALTTVQDAAPGTLVRVIPADLPPLVAPSRAAARASLGLDDAPRALLLGIIRQYKGVGLLADAWPEVQDALPGARLTVVGSLPDPVADLERLAKNDSVDVQVGWLSDDDVLRWAAAADLLLLPYFHGVHSAILHNAVAGGTPVLASPALAEEVERFRAGRVVALDPASWAVAIIDALVEHPLAAPVPPRRGAQANATAELYRELMSR